MTQPATRLITLIMLLQRRPNQKAADLAKKLGVSVRTLHRYFSNLDEMGIPVYTERGPHGGFSLVRGYRMPPLVFTPEEAAAVTLGTSLVEEIWGSLYRDAALGALAKLENVLPDEQQKEIGWARRALVVTGLHRAELNALAPLLEKLRQGIRELRTVNLVYRSSSRTEPQPRDLDPYVLVHRWGWWYVIGYCHLRQQIRIFRVDRIVELSLSRQVFQVPADFDIQAYLMTESHDQQRLQARIRFIPQAANVALANRSFWETVEEQPDGSVVVTLLAPDLGWAASSVLAYGPIVTVLEPPELRQMVGEWAKAISKQYEPGVSP
jgi:predicted DNA-binding transcriptional regulator YafY